MPERQSGPWEIVDRRELFNAEPWIRLFVQQVRLPDGRMVDDYYEIALPEYAVIFAQVTDGRVVTERQYKHGVGRAVVVFPAGLIAPGEDPLAAAKRELLEETGYAADEWRPLGSFVVNGNYGCGRANLFAARSARQVVAAQPGDLEDIEVALLSIDELFTMMRGGDVTLLSTVATLALATHPRFGE